MRIYIIIFLLVIQFAGYGQSDSTSAQGEIITSEVIIEKDKEIILPRVDKLFRRASHRSFESDPLSIQLLSIEPNLVWPPYKSDVPYKSFSKERVEKNYPNYLKLGYGNFNSPLAEVGLFKSWRSIDFQTKAYYESFKTGPVNESNSGNSIGGVDVSATYKKGSMELTPFVNYAAEQYRFYGNTDIDNTPFRSESLSKINRNDISMGVELKGQNTDIKYFIKPEFSINNQYTKNSSKINGENTFRGLGGLTYKIGKTYSTGLDIEGISAAYSGGLKYDRSLINLTPWLSFVNDGFNLKVGFNIASQSVNNAKTTAVYPDIKGQLQLTKEWSVYALLMGGVQWNGLDELLTQNQFLDDSLILVNTQTKFEFGGGIKGSPIDNLLLDANIRFGKVDDLPLFIPSVSDSSRFILTYDNGTIDRFTLDASLTFTPSSTSTFGATLLINGYSTQSIDKAWHLPTFVFKGYTSHNINEKLIASATVLFTGGIKAPANVDFGYRNLDSFLDIGLGLNYLLTNRISAYIDVNNLLNKEYQRYIGYPVRGLTFKVGGKYRF